MSENEAQREEWEKKLDSLKKQLAAKAKRVSPILQFDASEYLRVQDDVVQSIALLHGLYSMLFLWTQPSPLANSRTSIHFHVNLQDKTDEQFSLRLRELQEQKAQVEAELQEVQVQLQHSLNLSNELEQDIESYKVCFCT